MCMDAKIRFCRFKVVKLFHRLLSLHVWYSDFGALNNDLFLSNLSLGEMAILAGKVNNITIDKCTKMGVVFKVSVAHAKYGF